MLERWFYISTSRLNEPDAEGHVKDIVATSLQRNQLLQVTGVLLYTGCRFAQYIEGSAAAMAELQESILQDPRHQDINTLACGPFCHRYFSDWAYVDPSQFVASKVGGVLTDALTGHGKTRLQAG